MSTEPSTQPSPASGRGSASAAARFGSGRAINRIEDAELLRGRGRFVDNVVSEAGDGVLWVAFLRSPHAHARIAAVDVAQALAMPGVAAVYTGQMLVDAGVQAMPSAPNFTRADGKPCVTPPRRALAHGFARYAGEAVAMAVADSRDAAKDAVDAIGVEYDDLPSVASLAAALAAGAPAVDARAPDNIAAEMRHGDAERVEAAFAAAAHRITLDLVNQRLVAAPMEPRSVAMRWIAETDRLEVRIASQMPTSVVTGITEALPNLPKEQVRVVVGDVGGGFGMKTGPYPEDIAIAHAARDLKRSLRWQAERSEDFIAAVHGRDLASRAELALDASGKALALRVVSHTNVGAYATPVSVAIQLLIGPWVATSIYDIPAIDLHLHAVLTNTASIGAYRGAGRPESIYIIERLFDAAARELKLDPAELRRLNMIRREQMPYRNALAQTYDSGAFEQILDQGLDLADWNGFAARRAGSKARGRLRGRGIATFMEWTGGNVFEETVSVDITPDGFIEIFSATQGMGQGIQTSYAQLAVDVFGVPIDRVRIVQGDTDRGNGFGSAGSRSLFAGGSAVQVASERTVEHAKALAADALEASAGDLEYDAGRFRVAGTDLVIDLFDLAGRQPERRIRLESTSAVGGPTWPNGCHICEVEVDPETGEVKLVSYASVNDIGRVVSPTIARGQVDGGAVQGIGQALGERVVYDEASGQLLTGSFMDYALPRAEEGVMFRTEFDESVPCGLNPLGVKGVGELGTIGATPAVMNAVIDALADAGGLGRAAETIAMPATPERVWRMLNARR